MLNKTNVFNQLYEMLGIVDKLRCLAELRCKDDEMLTSWDLSPKLIKGDIDTALAYLFPESTDHYADQEKAPHYYPDVAMVRRYLLRYS